MASQNRTSVPLSKLTSFMAKPNEFVIKTMWRYAENDAINVFVLLHNGDLVVLWNSGVFSIGISHLPACLFYPISLVLRSA